MTTEGAVTSLAVACAFALLLGLVQLARAQSRYRRADPAMARRFEGNALVAFLACLLLLLGCLVFPWLVSVVGVDA